jgi:hypothetical protein
MSRLLPYLALAALLLNAAPLVAAPAAAVETVVESATETVHQWPQGPVKFTRKLTLTWRWTPLGPRRHGVITRVQLESGGDGAAPVKYDSKTAPATPPAELPVEVAGYAALVTGSLDIEPGATPQVFGQGEFVQGLLDRLGAPNAPIRQRVLQLGGEEFTPTALQTLATRALAGSPPGGGEQGAPRTLDLGAAKVQLALTGSSKEESARNDAAVAPFAAARVLATAQTGTATVLEKAPSLEALPPSWPVSITTRTTITSRPAP